MGAKYNLDKQELENKYLELQTIKSVANYFNVSKSTIQKYFREFGITCASVHNDRSKNFRKYHCDDNIFSIDNEMSFYIAGFIAADGCIQHHKTKNSYELAIRLSTNDESHLIKINEAFKSNRPIRRYENKYTGISALLITSKKMFDDLSRFNICPNKSLILTFPKWLYDHPLKNHFMRGYSDGDGCFYIHKQSNEKVCFNLRGTQSFLSDYRNILEQECNFAHREYDIPTPNGCGMLAYGGNRNIIKISNFLYNDATIFLNRKKEIALKANQLVGNLYAQNS